MSQTVGNIYRYRDSAHCRHGLAIITSDGAAHDTYWAGFSLIPRGDSMVDAPLWHVDHLSQLTPDNLLGNISEFTRSHRDECDLYKNEDVIYLPIGGGSECWYRRISAQPDVQKSLETIQYRLRQAISRATSATQDAVSLFSELERLQQLAKENRNA